MKQRHEIFPELAYDVSKFFGIPRLKLKKEEAKEKRILSKASKSLVQKLKFFFLVVLVFIRSLFSDNI